MCFCVVLSVLIRVFAGHRHDHIDDGDARWRFVRLQDVRHFRLFLVQRSRQGVRNIRWHHTERSNSDGFASATEMAAQIVQPSETNNKTKQINRANKQTQQSLHLSAQTTHDNPGSMKRYAEVSANCTNLEFISRRMPTNQSGFDSAMQLCMMDSHRKLFLC